SYCPYSHFHVGAAAKLANGIVMRGSNQENAAYPSGLCAERTALFAAGAQYPEQPVTKLAIACFTGGHFTKEPGSPCGACRQVMLETEHRYGGKMEVLLYGEEETYVFESAADLLPLIFVSENLKAN
ncbi:MAG: cytidine deaminase, partial [Paludibacteraceae bacterium]|nr:cytidine deaminase [Paludibacteraceae bacterium]